MKTQNDTNQVQIELLEARVKLAERWVYQREKDLKISKLILEKAIRELNEMKNQEEGR